MADNLESYFKKHLTKDTPGEDNWNVPSDDVWDKVLPEISKKKGLFIPWKYLYILIVIVLAGLAFILWPTADDAVLNTEEIEGIANNDVSKATQNKSITPNKTAETPNLNKAKAENESLASTEIINKDITHTNSNILTQKSESSSNQYHVAKDYLSEEIDNRMEPVQKVLFIEDVHEIREQNEIAGMLSVTIDLPLRPVEKKLLNKNVTTYALPVDLEKKKPEPFDNRGKFGIGVSFKPTFTSTYLSGEMNTGFMETGNMYLYVSNWGFEARYYLSNRFTLVTGIERSEIKSWSKSLVDFGYDTSTEHIMGNGQKENTSPVPMPTPFGEIDTEITYRFPAEEEIPDGELMNSELETHQEVRYLTIPFGLEYTMMRFRHFSWFSEGGIAYNRALRDGTSFTSRILHEGHDMDVVSEIMTSHPSYTMNYLNFYIGTGVNYQFSKAFQINGSARYFGSITKVNLQDNLSTYVQGFNFKIGIVYLF
jgi:hypothetical protein